MKQKILITIGTCIVVAGIGVGATVFIQHINRIKPVSDNVTDTASRSNTNAGNISVTNSSPDSGIQQASGNNSNTSSTTSSTSASQASELTNPSTFGQYNTAKYTDANDAFYINLQTGTGATLSKSGQKAVISYKGWLTNGTLFDETKVNAQGQSEAFEFTFDASPEQVVPGFDEGLGGMKIGGTRLVIIPPAAGYGSTAHDSIPANSVLIFEVSLDEIQ